MIDISCTNALETALAPLRGVHRRQVRVRALRFLAYCEVSGIDPLVVSQTDWESYVRGEGWNPQRAWKEASAVRRVLSAAARLPTDHGLGAGAQTWREPPGGALSERLAAFEAVCYPDRGAVCRSGLRRLKTWADEVGVPLDEVTPRDVDDYDFWVRQLHGRSSRELLVIARDWRYFLSHGGRRPRVGQGVRRAPGA